MAQRGERSRPISFVVGWRMGPVHDALAEFSDEMFGEKT